MAKNLNIGNSSSPVHVNINEKLMIKSNVVPAISGGATTMGSTTIPTYVSDGLIVEASDKFTFWKDLGDTAAGVKVDDYLLRTGGTMIGPLALSADPTAAMQATTKNYVDSNFLKLSGGTLTGDLWIKKNTPRLYIKDTSTSTDGHSIIHFGNKDTNNAAYIFLNGPSRTDDGGVNMMTIRNNVGNLRLDNAVTVSKTLTTSQEITVVGGNGASAGNYCQFRGISGSYGFMIRNDGANTYFLLTDSGDEYGGWNELRPLRINNKTGDVYGGTRIYNAVWNDFAEFRQTSEDIEPGRCVKECGDGNLILTESRMEFGCNICSDTYGMSVGESDTAKTPLAVAGRCLVYPYENRELFTPGAAVCSGPNGTVSVMTREEIKEYPECIVGTVSEIPTYEYWSEKNIKVNGRIWIKVR